MCRKYITIFDTCEDTQTLYDETLVNWLLHNGRPELDINDDNFFDLHKTQKCRMGGRVCELCDNFKIERVEFPNCEADCDCKLTPALQQEIIGREYLKKLHEIADLQFEHVKYNIIKGVRQKYPDRHVMIVECGLQRENGRDLVYAEVLIFKHPTWLKPIEGDHQCQCQSKELIDGTTGYSFSIEHGLDGFRQRFPSLKMVYSYRHSDGTDLGRLNAELERYEAIINGQQDSADLSDDSTDDDDDQRSSDEETDEADWRANVINEFAQSLIRLIDWEAHNRERQRRIQHHQRLRNLAEQERLAEVD